MPELIFEAAKQLPAQNKAGIDALSKKADNKELASLKETKNR
jgi:hypothetical protein